MYKQLVTFSVVTLFAIAQASAGGEPAIVDKTPQRSRASVSNTRAHIAALQAGLYAEEAKAVAAVDAAMLARRQKVQAVRPVQDKFGDPMYTWYGPLPAEPGTPNYDGPRYGASFSRAYAQPVPSAEYRGYLRGRYSQPGIISRTDTTLGVAANNSYMQHGMQVAPGSMYPSAARVMINNP